MGKVARSRSMENRFVLVQIRAVYLAVIHMIGNNAKTVVLPDFRQVVFSVILPERFITPLHLFLDEIPAYQGAPHQLVQLRADTNVLLFIFHRDLLFCRRFSVRPVRAQALLPQ